MKKLLTNASLLSLGLVFAGAATAQANQAESEFYLSPGIVVTDVHNIFDRNKDVDFKRRIGASFGVGYKIDKNWAVEFNYDYTKTTRKYLGNTFRIHHGHFDGLYTFDEIQSSGVSPYVVWGVGQTRYKTGDKDIIKGFDKTDTTFNAGAGIKYAISPNVQLRTDARYTIGTRHGDSGMNVNLGFAFFFN